MKRIMKRLGPLLLSLILCVGTIIPLTGAGINKIFTITLMADIVNSVEKGVRRVIK